MLMESNILLTMYSLHLENLFDILNAMIHTGISSELRTKLRTWAICGRPGLAATLRQHCPQMTQRRCTGSSKRKGAKFGEGSSVRADWLCIGCPKLREKPISGHSFCMSL